MTMLHLSRIRLRDDASVGALAGLLFDENGDAHAAKVHRLIWSLFADDPGRQRDFLWRDDGGEAWRRRTFLTLSARPPQDAVRLFDRDQGVRARTCARSAPAFSFACKPLDKFAGPKRQARQA